jgi:hypothetical protein
MNVAVVMLFAVARDEEKLNCEYALGLSSHDGSKRPPRMSIPGRNAGAPEYVPCPMRISVFPSSCAIW